MGHTVASQRIVLDILNSELLQFGKAMRAKDRERYERMLKRSYQHYGSMSYADSFHSWAFLLLSIMLEQEKEICRLRAELNRQVEQKLTAEPLAQRPDVG
jgi:hypothetical protein